MFIVTNREVKPSASGFRQLGLRPSPLGPNELRLVEATQQAGAWKIKVLPDVLTARMRKDIGMENSDRTLYASDYVARVLFDRVQNGKKNLLFFVHGYNNDIEAVLERAVGLEQLYNVEVIAFSWPADGGGAAGVASYLSDKRDARASAGALDRCLGRMAELFQELIREQQDTIKAKVDERFHTVVDREKRNALLMELQHAACPFSINMMAHSMGNYLYQYVILPRSSYARFLIFDNVVLVAADANNLSHAVWVDRIPCRKSVYITLNENDQALRLSRAKIGDEQLPRLGHYRHDLVSRHANYIDFTDCPRVGNGHAYFEGEPVADRAAPVYQFFNKVFNGGSAYEYLLFDSGIGAYRFK